MPKAKIDSEPNIKDSPMIGELGQRVEIGGHEYRIGDIVKLLHTRTNTFNYFIIIFDEKTLSLYLHNPNNIFSNPGSMSSGNILDEAYISLSQLKLGHLAYCKIEPTDKKSIPKLKMQKFKYRPTK